MKMCDKKIIGLLVALVTSGITCNAQDDAQFTFFPWATSYYNAGGIGEQNNTLCFTAIYQNKYMGWNDVYLDESGNKKMDKTAPQDFLLNIESYLKKLRGSVGLSIISDRLGYYNNTGIKLGYSYKLRLGPGHLGIGAQLAMYNQKIKANWRPIDEGDAVLEQTKEGSNLDLDFNLGIQYRCSNWYAGVSVTQLGSAFDKKHALRLSGDKEHIARTPQLYFHGGYNWIIPSNPNWELIPHAMIKTDLHLMQLDLMLLTRYNGLWWGGIDYRIQDAVSLMFGARPFNNSSNIYLKGMDIGVAYSFTTNKLAYRKNRSAGDVEVMIRYCFDIYKEEVFFGYGSTRSIYKNQY